MEEVKIDEIKETSPTLSQFHITFKNCFRMT
jgi:hypothetical protein